MERGAMKHRLTAGVRDVDALLRVAWQKGEVSNGPMERAELRSLGHASLRWGLGMCPGSWQGSKGGRAGESLGGVLHLCPARLTWDVDLGCEGRWELWARGRGNREQLLSGLLLALSSAGVFREPFQRLPCGRLMETVPQCPGLSVSFQVGSSRQLWVEGGTGLLDLPLGLKIPVLPNSKLVFCRTKLGKK